MYLLGPELGALSGAFCGGHDRVLFDFVALAPLCFSPYDHEDAVVFLQDLFELMVVSFLVNMNDLVALLNLVLPEISRASYVPFLYL